VHSSEKDFWHAIPKKGKVVKRPSSAKHDSPVALNKNDQLLQVKLPANAPIEKKRAMKTPAQVLREKEQKVKLIRSFAEMMIANRKGFAT
jgi:hypothetical protein